MPSFASPDPSWLRLLHDGSPRHLFEARRDALVRSGAKSEALHEADLALMIHDRLADLARQGRELSALNTVARRLASVQRMDSVLAEVVTQTRQLLGTDVTYLMLREPSGDRLRIEVVDGSLGSVLRGIELAPGEGLGGEVLRTGQPLWVESYVDAPGLRHVTSIDAAAVSEHLGGMLGLPLRAGHDVLGVLIAADRRPRRFMPAEVELLAGLAAHAAISVSNARLFESLERALENVQETNARLGQTLEQRSRESTLREALGVAVVAGADAAQLCQVLSDTVGAPVHLVRGDTRHPGHVGPQPGTPSNATGAVRGSDSLPESVFATIGELADDPRPTSRRLDKDSGDDPAGTADVGAALAPIILSDGCAGWLVLCTDGPSTPEQLQLLVIGAASVAVVLAHERTLTQVELRARGELLRALLDADIDIDTVRRRAAGVGVDLGAVSAVMVIRGAERAQQAAQQQSLFFLARETGSWAGDHDDEFVLLALGPTASAIRDRVRLVSNLGQATVGITPCSGGVEATRKAYVAARQTALVLQALERFGGIALGGELGAYQALLSHAGRGDLRAFVDATIGDLIRSDEERGRDLTKTVARYLANAQHHARTCAELHIHANTLYARLERVTELLGTTWRDADRLLEIQLALRMRELVVRIEAGPGAAEL